MAATRFIIESYIGAVPIRFGMTPSDVEEKLGQPRIKSRNFRKDLTYDYGDFNIGFDQNGSACHIGFLPGAKVFFEGMPIFSNQSFYQLCGLDDDAKEVVGFVILLNLGLAFTGFHDGDENQKTVSVFAKGSYDELKSKMKDFSVE